MRWRGFVALALVVTAIGALATCRSEREVLTDPKKLAGWWTTDTRGQFAIARHSSSGSTDTSPRR
jgi:hypothetical protein